MAEDELPALDPEAYAPFLRAALEEDGAGHDLTAEAVVPGDRHVVADIVAKQEGVLAGLSLAAPTFRLLDPDARVQVHYADGDTVSPGAKVLTVEGRARALLGAERTVLNVLRHLSGVATLTKAFVEAT